MKNPEQHVVVNAALLSAGFLPTEVENPEEWNEASRLAYRNYLVSIGWNNHVDVFNANPADLDAIPGDLLNGYEKPAKVKVAVEGDVNGDGVVDATDAALTAFELADTNDDNVVDEAEFNASLEDADEEVVDEDEEVVDEDEEDGSTEA